ncbi:MAG: PAS domain-containing protein [Ferruginibacter sp.]
MKPIVTKQTETEAYLSVSYKAEAVPNVVTQVQADSVIVTDTQFCITGFNTVAASFFGLTEAQIATTTISDALILQYKNTSRNKIVFTLFKTGNWNGEVIYTNAAGEERNFFCNVVLLNNTSIVINSKLIGDGSNDYQLPVAQTTEAFFRLFMDNTQTGCWIYDEDNYIIFC